MTTLPLPIGNVDLFLEPLLGDLHRLRWTDAITAEVVEADATLDQLAAWQREGGPPDSLKQRRQSLDTAISVARSRVEGNRSELSQLGK